MVHLEQGKRCSRHPIPACCAHRAPCPRPSWGAEGPGLGKRGWKIQSSREAMAVERARMQGSRKGRHVQDCRLEITFPPHCYSCAAAISRSCRQPAGSAQTRAGRQGAGPGGGCRAEYRGERRACDQIFLLLLAVFISRVACFMCAAPGALRGRGDTGACCSKEAVAPAAGAAVPGGKGTAALGEVLVGHLAQGTMVVDIHPKYKLLISSHQHPVTQAESQRLQGNPAHPKGC